MVQDTGEKGENGMKKRNSYTKAPDDISEAILSGKRIKDFLPPPDQLVKKDETMKVTISLSKRSIDFFKKCAKDQGVPYQSMIKSIIDKYTDYYSH